MWKLNYRDVAVSAVVKKANKILNVPGSSGKWGMFTDKQQYKNRSSRVITLFVELVEN
jgi:hypothetical protein